MNNNTDNLGRFLTETARRFPDRPAIILSDQQVTWQHLNRRVDSLAQSMVNSGIKSGDTILAIAENSLCLLEAQLATLKIGGIWVPLDSSFDLDTCSTIAAKIQPSAIIYQDELKQQAISAIDTSHSLKTIICDTNRNTDSNQHSYKSVIEAHLSNTSFTEHEVSSQDVCWLVFGYDQKSPASALELTHSHLVSMITLQLIELTPGLSNLDCTIACSSMQQATGIYLLAHIARGAQIVLPTPQQLKPRAFWQLVEKQQVSNFFITSEALSTLCADISIGQYKYPKLQHVVYSGTPLYQKVDRWAQQSLGPVLVHYYGAMGEIGPIAVVTAQAALDQQTPTGSRGRNCFGSHLAILDKENKELPPGESGFVACRSQVVNHGYRESDKQQFNGWHKTGDIGYLDESGFLFISPGDQTADLQDALHAENLRKLENFEKALAAKHLQADQLAGTDDFKQPHPLKSAKRQISKVMGRANQLIKHRLSHSYNVWQALLASTSPKEVSRR